jgi:hypothetical protein
MTAADIRAPQPELIGNIDPLELAGINNILGFGQRLNEHYHPDKLLVDFPNTMPAEFFEILHPVSKIAIDNYMKTHKGYEPAEAHVVVTHVDDLPGATQYWHRDQHMAGAETYLVASSDSSESAVGRGSSLLDFIPCIATKLTDVVVKRLLTKELVEITSANPGDVTVIDQRHIHRRPVIQTQPGRVAVAIGLFPATEISQIQGPALTPLL